MTVYNLDDRLQENRNVWKEYSEKITIEGVIRTLFIFALIIIIVGYLNQHGAILSLSNIMSDFYANASSELISIVITVAILERLNSRRVDEQELIRLKALLASKEVIVTSIAVAELKARGWLKDGSLKGTDLQGANLSGIDLTGANLEGVRLNTSKLYETCFFGANLEGAQLGSISAEGASFGGANLTKAYLAGANLYNTNLVGANLDHIKWKPNYSNNSELERVILPDGSYWEADTDLRTFTDENSVVFWMPYEGYINQENDYKD